MKSAYRFRSVHTLVEWMLRQDTARPKCYPMFLVFALLAGLVQSATLCFWCFFCKQGLSKVLPYVFGVSSASRACPKCYPMFLVFALQAGLVQSATLCFWCICTYMQLYAAICTYMQLCATICSYMQLYATICSYMQSMHVYAPICTYMQLHALIWICIYIYIIYIY